MLKVGTVVKVTATGPGELTGLVGVVKYVAESGYIIEADNKFKAKLKTEEVYYSHHEVSQLTANELQARRRKATKGKR